MRQELTTKNLQKYAGQIVEVQDEKHDRLLRGLIKEIKVSAEDNGAFLHLTIETQKMTVNNAGLKNATTGKYVETPERIYRTQIPYHSLIIHPAVSPELTIYNQKTKETILILDKKSSEEVGLR